MSTDRLTDHPTSALLAERNSTSGWLQFDPIKDIRAHHDADGDSYYLVHYLEGGGYQFTVLLHLMLVYNGPGGPLAQIAVSILNETTLEYFSEVKDYPLDKISLAETTASSKTELNIDTPIGHLRGSLDDMTVEAAGLGGEWGLSIKMRSLGPPLPNLVTGVIPFAGGVNYEFALPRIETSGRLTFRNETYDVKGTSWFDRQWGRFGPYKWTWMAVQLENGVKMSLWDQQPDNDNAKSFVAGKRAFVTILHPDGCIAVAAVAVQEHDLWESPKSHQLYATRWSVSIPSRRSELNVTLVRKDQEIFSPELPRMEGKGSVQGNYEGSDVSGAAFVELFNLFPLFLAAYNPSQPQAASPPR